MFQIVMIANNYI